MTEFWVCFSCCVAEQPQPKRRRRIDRSMIGEPTNFIHMTHVGSGDMGLGAVSNLTLSLQFKVICDRPTASTQHIAHSQSGS
uniref:CRIB domain-containing protein n=1 Tax=Sinocyclocheilus rhinocerous TaxID=307959 RepID=A0A673GP32_9TELE